MTSTIPAETAPATTEPGPPTNYLDHYGLSKSPFGGASESMGYILFDSHRRAFDLLIGHVVNSSGVIILQGPEGIGKTEALCSAATVAAESGLTAVMVSRPPNGRTSLTQLRSALKGELSPGDEPGLEDNPTPEDEPSLEGESKQGHEPGPEGESKQEHEPGLESESRLQGDSNPKDEPAPETRSGAEDTTIDDAVKGFLQPPRKALLIDDIDLMPENCVRLLLSLAKLVPNNRNGPAIVLSSSLDLTADPKGSALSQLVSLAHNTIRLPRLGPSEIRQYIERSLWIAGGTTRRLIASDAMKLLIARSGGTPGMTNRLMDAVLTAGFARGDWIITSKTVAGAMGPTAPRPRNREKAPPGMAGRVIQIGATGLLVLGAAVFLYKGLHDRFDRKTHTPPKAIAPAAPSAPSIGATHPAKPTAAAVPGDVTHPQQTSSAKPAATLSPALIAALLKRGDQSLGLGDVAAARLLYQRAADAGNAVASAAIGMTYDPNYVVPGQTPDPARAAEWYRKAVALGNPHAADLLKQLGPR